MLKIFLQAWPYGPKYKMIIDKRKFKGKLLKDDKKIFASVTVRAKILNEEKIGRE